MSRSAPGRAPSAPSEISLAGLPGTTRPGTSTAKSCTPVRFRSPPPTDSFYIVAVQTLFFVDPAVSAVVLGRPPETSISRPSRAHFAPRSAAQEVVELGYVQKRDGRYRARYRDPVGKMTSRTFLRKADTERFVSSGRSRLAL